MGKRELNEAIIQKVTDILENTNDIQHLCIIIDGGAGEVPQIRYNITENIVPEKNEPIKWNLPFPGVKKDAE